MHIWFRMENELRFSAWLNLYIFCHTRYIIYDLRGTNSKTAIFSEDKSKSLTRIEPFWMSSIDLHPMHAWGYYTLSFINLKAYTDPIFTGKWEVCFPVKDLEIRHSPMLSLLQIINWIIFKKHWEGHVFTLAEKSDRKSKWFIFEYQFNGKRIHINNHRGLEVCMLWFTR